MNTRPRVKLFTATDIYRVGIYCSMLFSLSPLQHYCPDLSSLPTTNGPWSQGDGIQLGEALGAQLIHMEHVQVHPTGFVDPGDPDNGTKVRPDFTRPFARCLIVLLWLPLLQRQCLQELAGCTAHQ
eukprot:GHUV01037931.1.p1 GENE.GHUV01037931.1~~GHUV01037931.1.p1  ORF type:complete len:126 (-),score=7.30 GHUV01037931.1:209-586(-)